MAMEEGQRGLLHASGGADKRQCEEAIQVWRESIPAFRVHVPRRSALARQGERREGSRWGGAIKHSCTIEICLRSPRQTSKKKTVDVPVESKLDCNFPQRNKNKIFAGQRIISCNNQSKNFTLYSRAKKTGNSE